MSFNVNTASSEPSYSFTFPLRRGHSIHGDFAEPKSALEARSLRHPPEYPVTQTINY